MINLLIDIGNTSVKACFAHHFHLEEAVHYYKQDILQFITSLVDEREVDVIAISCVRKIDKEYFQPLTTICNSLVIIDSNSKYFLINKYKSPETLGPDRLVASLAASTLFPGKDLIVFDFGTALTIDFISAKGEFLGGNISLGLNSRFKALNDYTQLLPKIEIPQKVLSIGESTQEAIESGVVLGLIFEVKGYLDRFQNHIYVFTGGDAIYFAEKLKSPIFVVYNLVLMGLARVAQDYAKW